MYLKFPYVHYRSVVPPQICDGIIDVGRKRLVQAKTNQRQDTRESKIAWLDDKRIYDLVLPYIKDANQKAGWNWFFDRIEPIQFTKYGVNQFYDWHYDGGSDFLSVYKNQSDSGKNGKVRKISVTVNLVDGNEYSGGDLKFDFGPLEGKKRFKVCEEIRPKGSIIIFPSFMYHTVTPVTKGTRYSLVMWALGKPWQ